jgi:ribose transport system permease protein
MNKVKPSRNILIIIILYILITFALLISILTSVDNINYTFSFLFSRWMPVALAAAGFSFAAAGGIIDISTGGIALLSASVSAFLISKGINLFSALMAGACISVIAGIISFGIYKILKVDSIVTTFITLLLVKGVSGLFIGGRIARFSDLPLRFSGNSHYYFFVVILVVIILLTFISFYSGSFIKMRLQLTDGFHSKFICAAFILTSLFAGFAGLIVFTSTGSLDPVNNFKGFEFDVILACAAGGCFNKNNKLLPFTAAAGAFILAELDTLLMIFSLNSGVQSILKGIIVLSVLLYGYKSRSNRKLQLNQTHNHSLYLKFLPLIAGIVIIYYLTGSGNSISFIRTFFASFTFPFLIALAVVPVLNSGAIDMSVTGVASLASIVFIRVVAVTGYLPALFIALFTGFLIGCLNGIFAVKMKDLPEAVTLASMFITAGIAKVIQMSGDYKDVLVLNLNFFLQSTILIVIFFIAFTLFFRTSFFHKNILIYFRNFKKNSLPVKSKSFYSVYSISGLTAAGAGIVYSLNAAVPYFSDNLTILFQAVAALAIGGASFRGGGAYPVNALFGVIVFKLIEMTAVDSGIYAGYLLNIFSAVLIFIFIAIQNIEMKSVFKNKVLYFFRGLYEK